MKKKKTMLAVAAAAALGIMLSSVPGVSADTTNKYTDTNGTATNWLTGNGITVTTEGSTTTSKIGETIVYSDKECEKAFKADVTASDPTTEIKKVLVVPDDATIPECGFTFTATAGTAITPAAEGKLPVFAGVNPEKIKWNIVTPSSNAFPNTFTNENVTALDVTKVETGTTSSAANVEYVPNVVTTGIKDANIGNSTTLKTPTDNVVIMKGDDETYYAVKEFQLDFSECVFTEPGVYRYILTESNETGTGAKANMGITNDENLTRTLDVYVEDASYYTEAENVVTFHPTLRITKYILYTGNITDAPKKADSATAGTDPTTKFEDGSERTDEYGLDNEVEAVAGKKSVGFKNTYKTNKLKITKTVTGNQGSRDQYFKFTLKSTTDSINNENLYFYVAKNTVNDTTITNITTGLTTVNEATPYEATDINSFIILPATANLSSDSIVGVFTGRQLHDGIDIYLQHDQCITITGLPKDIQYSITEEGKDYSVSASVKSGTGFDNHSDETKGNDGTYTDGTAITATRVGTDNNWKVEDTRLIDNAQIDFTNEKEGVIPTGVILSVAAPVIIGIIAAAGIIAIFMRKRRKAD